MNLPAMSQQRVVAIGFSLSTVLGLAVGVATEPAVGVAVYLGGIVGIVAWYREVLR